MPRARALSSYPSEFWEIMERCTVNGEIVSHTFASKHDAARLQGKFYAFRQAVKRELDSLIAHPERYTQAQADAIRNLNAWSAKVVFWYDRAGPDTDVRGSFMSRDQTPEAAMLRDMLGRAQPGVAASQAAATASAERMRQLFADPAAPDSTDPLAKNRKGYY